MIQWWGFSDTLVRTAFYYVTHERVFCFVLAISDKFGNFRIYIAFHFHYMLCCTANIGTTKLQTAVYAEKRWSVYQLNSQRPMFCGDLGSTPGQYFHEGLWMFGVVLLIFASSARLGGATDTWLERISITIFIYWACEHKTAVNKLQFNKRKYRWNFKVAIIKSYLQDGRTTWLANVL